MPSIHCRGSASATQIAVSVFVSWRALSAWLRLRCAVSPRHRAAAVSCPPVPRARSVRNLFSTFARVLMWSAPGCSEADQNLFEQCPRAGRQATRQALRFRARTPARFLSELKTSGGFADGYFFCSLNVCSNTGHPARWCAWCAALRRTCDALPQRVRCCRQRSTCGLFCLDAGRGR